MVTPRLSYFICATPRSGTVLLCDALAGTGVAGQPEEYFYAPGEPIWAATWGLGDYSYGEYLEAVLAHGTTLNGVFGVKMMWTMLDPFARRVREIPRYADLNLPQLLSAVFPDLHYVWLSRGDKVAQGVSHWRAIQTGVWHVDGEGRQGPDQALRYDFAAIDHLVREAEAHDAAWHQYFMDNGIEPFKVTYEDLTTAYEETVCQVLGFLGISMPGQTIPRPRTAKQGDAVSAEWARRYRDTVWRGTRQS